MTLKKDRDRVIAEITLSHLLRLANEYGCPVNRKQALVFLNQEGRAFEMWKQMMQAGEDFVLRSLLGKSIGRECKSDGVWIHALKRWLTVTATLLWRKSLAVLARLPVCFFQFRAGRDSRKLFSPALRVGRPTQYQLVPKALSQSQADAHIRTKPALRHAERISIGHMSADRKQLVLCAVGTQVARGKDEAGSVIASGLGSITEPVGGFCR